MTAIKSRNRRGIASVQVMVAVGVASIIGTAMLATSAMQVQATYNYNRSSQADSLAESGVNLAAFYLDNPLKAPSLNVAGHWPGGNNISLGSEVDGKIDVSVTKNANDDYVIASTGKSGEINRTVSATIRLNKGIPIKRALSFGNTVTLGLNTQVTGHMQVDGGATLLAGLTLNGDLYTTSTALISGLLNGIWRQVSKSEIHIPTASTINDYRTYVVNGVTHNAGTIASSTLGGATAVTLGPTPGNPAGIYVFQGVVGASPATSFNLNGNVTINGTLIVRDATLVINGLNNVVAAQNGYPAVVAYKDIRINGRPRSALFRGVTWVGGSVNSALISLGSVLDIDGALFFGGSGNVDTLSNATVRITYNPAVVSVPELDKRYKSGGPTIVSWDE